MRNIPEIKLYGEKGCMKTHYYQLLLNKIGLQYKFLDVIENEDYAAELRSLYTTNKLNFPTITIGSKKLRNPYKDELLKWMHKLIPSMLEIQHDKKNKKYTLNINCE